ncbi:hypothetical protein LCGC14_0845900 [marine sediment metagenome]|uniref:Uncharacterized protein n=1 Tax=marine sediment metagenome TaxID=412755 RepID=A0A0F9PGN4_9ZZZZ
MKVYPVKVTRSWYRFIKHLCAECGNLHMYPKYGTPDTRLDGRRFKYVCHKQTDNYAGGNN